VLLISTSDVSLSSYSEEIFYYTAYGVKGFAFFTHRLSLQKVLRRVTKSESLRVMDRVGEMQPAQNPCKAQLPTSAKKFGRHRCSQHKTIELPGRSILKSRAKESL
jgi:hypothetical protein